MSDKPVKTFDEQEALAKEQEIKRMMHVDKMNRLKEAKEQARKQQELVQQEEENNKVDRNKDFAKKIAKMAEKEAANQTGKFKRVKKPDLTDSTSP